MSAEVSKYPICPPRGTFDGQFHHATLASSLSHPGRAVHEEQQRVIEYLRTENQVLKEKLGKKRIMLNEDQRRRLAVKGKVLGRKTLSAIASIVTPDTILR